MRYDGTVARDRRLFVAREVSCFWCPEQRGTMGCGGVNCAVIHDRAALEQVQQRN